MERIKLKQKREGRYKTCARIEQNFVRINWQTDTKNTYIYKQKKKTSRGAFDGIGANARGQALAHTTTTATSAWEVIFRRRRGARKTSAIYACARKCDRHTLPAIKRDLFVVKKCPQLIKKNTLCSVIKIHSFLALARISRCKTRCATCMYINMLRGYIVKTYSCCD